MKYSALRAKQKGQSLLWVLGFLATMAVTFAGVYSVGQTTSEKQKIVNAVDAAAYTGGMVEARALNLTAYANRAEIANEVFVAQMVSMESWVAYFKQTINSFKTIATALTPIPVIGWIMAAIRTILQTVETVINTAQQPLNLAVTAAITGVEAYNIAYQSSIGILLSPAMIQGAQQAASSVLAANTANQNNKLDTAPVAIKTGVLFADNAFEWNRGFKRYSKGGSTIGSASDNRRNARDILLISRDQFSTERKGSNVFGFDLLWGNGSFGIPCVISIGASKDGPTNLQQYERWEAQDTSEYGLRLGSCKGGTGPGIPYGWGRSTAAQNATKGDARNSPHPLAGGLAYSAAKQHGGWSGVKALWDVDRNSNDNPIAAFDTDKEKLTFTVAAAKPKADIKNNESLNFMNRATTSKLGSPDLKSDFEDGQIAAVSSAKVFFARPARNNADITATSLFRSDSHKEISNLYNPYWQVRLMDVPLLTKELIYAGKNPILPTLVQ